MKELFDQIPKLIQMTLEKVSQVESSRERPEIIEAKKRLINNIQGITQELSNLSQKYGQDPKPQKRPPIILAKSPKEEKQLSFDFMEKK